MESGSNKRKKVNKNGDDRGLGQRQDNWDNGNVSRDEAIKRKMAKKDENRKQRKETWKATK